MSATRFIGLHVRVTLAEPPEEQIRGTVKEVGAGERLVLSHTRYVGLKAVRGDVGEVTIPVNTIVDVIIEEVPIEEVQEQPVQTVKIGQMGRGASENRGVPAIRAYAKRPGRKGKRKVVEAYENVEAMHRGESMREMQSELQSHPMPQLRPAVVDPAIVTYERKAEPQNTGKGMSDGSREGAVKGEVGSKLGSIFGEMPTYRKLPPDPSSEPADIKPTLVTPQEQNRELGQPAIKTPRHNGQHISSLVKADSSTVQHNNTEKNTVQLSQPNEKIFQPFRIPARSSGKTDEEAMGGDDPAATAATLTEPFSQIAIDNTSVAKDPQSNAARKEFLQPKTSNNRGKRAAKGQSKKKNAGNAVTQANLAPPSSNGNATMSRRSERKAQYQQDNNGWATGEASDIQDMSDFDFEANLFKFDKRKVFDEIRQGDATADEDRLHTFNRKPGSAAGKNLHHTENVLNSPKQAIAESSADDEAARTSSARGSDRSVRKSLSRNALARGGSDLANSEARVTGPDSLPDIQEAQRMSRVSSSRSAMRTPVTRSRQGPNQYQAKAHLRYAATNRPCPCLTPLQMLELEQLAISEYGLTEEMITENAGRAIADAAISLIHSHSDLTQPPLIVILAGNTKTGARAIAAARHLRNQKTKLVLCLMGLHREDNLLENVRRQLNMYRLSEGRVIKPEQLSRTVSRLGAINLVIEASLGMHLTFEDLSYDDQVGYTTICDWVTGEVQDQYDACSMAIDIPSGVDASTGAFIGPSHIVTPTLLLCLGAPKVGLVAAPNDGRFFQMSEMADSDDVRVADIGIPNAAWKRLGKKGARGIEFGEGASVKIVLAGET